MRGLEDCMWGAMGQEVERETRLELATLSLEG